MKKEIVDLIELYLTNEGYEVTKCYNGTDALNVIEKNDIDLELLMSIFENKVTNIKQQEVRLTL